MRGLPGLQPAGVGEDEGGDGAEQPCVFATLIDAASSSIPHWCCVGEAEGRACGGEQVLCKLAQLLHWVRGGGKNTRSGEGGRVTVCNK